jgi:membrane protein implicated in regulation of membrane protease activity
MIAIAFWVGLAALIAGIIKDSVPLSLLGASLFTPASFVLLFVVTTARIKIEDDEE